MSKRKTDDVNDDVMQGAGPMTSAMTLTMTSCRTAGQPDENQTEVRPKSDGCLRCDVLLRRRGAAVQRDAATCVSAAQQQQRSTATTMQRHWALLLLLLELAAMALLQL
ncbi:unnamed protein product [Sphagnum jensenii]|uniref:Uncharacterized protein n=1 Tax=Sphagnum jensenii TaxID=128206 RepID=A0ABP1C1C9_9BRYO